MSEQEMLFGDYVRVVLKRKWTVVLLTILVAAGAWLYASRQEPVFQSSTLIKIQRQQTFAEFFDEVMVSSSDPLANYVQEIPTAKVLGIAVELLKGSDHECELADLQGAASAERREYTDLIEITLVGETAEEARARANAVAEAFIIHHDESLTKSARDVKNAIVELRQTRMDALKAEEDKLKAELGNPSMIDAEFSEIKQLRTRLLDAQIRLETLRANGNFTEEYPEIVACKQEIAAIDGKLAGLMKRDEALQTKLTEYEQRREITRKMDEYFTQRLEEARIAEQRKGETVFVMEEARPGTRITTATAYLSFVGAMLGLMLGIVMAFIAENLDTSIRTLVEIEHTFGLSILGVIPNFTRARSDRPLRPEGLRDRIKYSSAALMWRATWNVVRPDAKRRASSKSSMDSLVVATSPRSPATEGYRGIRTNLRFAESDGSPIGAYLVTSSGPAEGKSTTIANLALTFAQNGHRTLLVGANMRRPSLYRLFGLERERGLQEILVGDLAWRETVKDYRDVALGTAGEELATTAGMENLSIITCGGRTIQPAEWLSQRVFGATLEEWKSEYDMVLVDGPPVLPVPDSVIMAGTVGNVILVYQCGLTQRDSMHRTISTLEKTGAAIEGLVLNDLKASWSSSPDYFHYRGYYGRPEKDAS